MAIEINPDDLKRLEEKYGEELVRRAASIIDTYTIKLSGEAKRIIADEGYRNTGRLINSISPSVKAYASKIKGAVRAGTKYARFIHEGAEHAQDNSLVSHYVPFSAAPSLLQWAKRHKVIEYSNGTWNFIDKKNQMHPIKDLSKSGMMVYTRPTKFFERPFAESKDSFIRDMTKLVEGN